MKHAHDLDALLLEVLAPFPAAPPIRISWAPRAEMADGQHWAQWRKLSTTGHWIGIWDGLQTAPRYVLLYLVRHEVLHVLLPPRRGCAHHKYFRIAERMTHSYLRATKWLDSHGTGNG
jgi:hypothetical protein